MTIGQLRSNVDLRDVCVSLGRQRSASPARYHARPRATMLALRYRARQALPRSLRQWYTDLAAPTKRHRPDRLTIYSALGSGWPFTRWFPAGGRCTVDRMRFGLCRI